MASTHRLSNRRQFDDVVDEVATYVSTLPISVVKDLITLTGFIDKSFAEDRVGEYFELALDAQTLQVQHAAVTQVNHFREHGTWLPASTPTTAATPPISPGLLSPRYSEELETSDEDVDMSDTASMFQDREDIEDDIWHDVNHVSPEKAPKLSGDLDSPWRRVPSDVAIVDLSQVPGPDHGLRTPPPTDPRSSVYQTPQVFDAWPELEPQALSRDSTPCPTRDKPDRIARPVAVGSSVEAAPPDHGQVDLLEEVVAEIDHVESFYWTAPSPDSEERLRDYYGSFQWPSRESSPLFVVDDMDLAPEPTAESITEQSHPGDANINALPVDGHLNRGHGSQESIVRPSDDAPRSTKDTRGSDRSCRPMIGIPGHSEPSMRPMAIVGDGTRRRRSPSPALSMSSMLQRMFDAEVANSVERSTLFRFESRSPSPVESDSDTVVAPESRVLHPSCSTSTKGKTGSSTVHTPPITPDDDDRNPESQPRPKRVKLCRRSRATAASGVRTESPILLDDEDDYPTLAARILHPAQRSAIFHEGAHRRTQAVGPSPSTTIESTSPFIEESDPSPDAFSLPGTDSMLQRLFAERCAQLINVVDNTRIHGARLEAHLIENTAAMAAMRLENKVLAAQPKKLEKRQDTDISALQQQLAEIKGQGAKRGTVQKEVMAQAGKRKRV